ncbi:MAG: hypothetical protein ACOCSK_00570 [Rhodothermales bacterium]
MKPTENRPPENLRSETPVVRKKTSPRRRRAIVATLISLAALILVVVSSYQFDTVARDLLQTLREAPPPVAEEEAAPVAEAAVLTYAEMDIHPDVLFQPYTSGSLLGQKGAAQDRMIEQFRELLSVYVQRQGIDDNFTIRLLDARTNETLELFSLENERRRYEDSDRVDWGAIDRLRRQETNRLVKKWAGNGVPQSDIMVRWGRANQIEEARERDRPYLEHELNLARMVGLSLLSTELATVETFNQDRLISSVGARSRYQMMPYILRQNGIHHYTLRTAAGNAVQVFEEWNPLLAMEASFITLKGYTNAVGHEIPGLSAYHTGPGNIFMVYRSFLNNNSSSLNPSTTVADAYLWAVTEGYDTVSRGTSFKTYSRGYVPSMYGALKASEDAPIDTTATILAERVQIKAGEEVFLSDLLEVLRSDGTFMERNRERMEQINGPSELYNQVRELNPHIQLPAISSLGNVPPAGDLRLTATADGVPVRFFLPVGSMDALEVAELDVIDRDQSFVFDRNAYGTPPSGEVTLYDRQYDELVESIGRFGFTNANRVRLLQLRSRFRELAEANPTQYRRLRLAVINVHAQIWQSSPFDRLATDVSGQEGLQRIEAQPLAQLGRAESR